MRSPRPAELNDTADAIGGGATRNAHARSTICRMHRLVHHLLGEVAVRTSSMRGLGAFANVFAIESFMDELADDRRRGSGDLSPVADCPIRARAR